MSGHTKGPWEVSIRTGCFGVFRAGKTPNCMSGAHDTAIVYQDGRGERFNGTGYCVLTDEQIANAHLLAAAPDLLKACEEAAALLNRIADTDYEIECQHRIEAAIRAANGE